MIENRLAVEVILLVGNQPDVLRNIWHVLCAGFETWELQSIFFFFFKLKVHKAMKN